MTLTLKVVSEFGPDPVESVFPQEEVFHRLVDELDRWSSRCCNFRESFRRIDYVSGDV